MWSPDEEGPGQPRLTWTFALGARCDASYTYRVTTWPNHRAARPPTLCLTPCVVPAEIKDTVLAPASRVSKPELASVLRVPRTVRRFQVRIELLNVKPTIWRRLLLPGNVTLDCVHSVLNGAMGWSDSHLHRFRTGDDPGSSHFITQIDLDEGEEGVLERDVRLDEVLAEEGDTLWYDYDFGDGWQHVVKVEAILPGPPEDIELLAGGRACPPEDVGGTSGYEGVVRWVESGCATELLPEQFENAEHAREWLPLDWRPATFDLEAARIKVRDVLCSTDD